MANISPIAVETALRAIDERAPEETQQTMNSWADAGESPIRRPSRYEQFSPFVIELPYLWLTTDLKPITCALHRHCDSAG
jgi:hypothetical protein